MRATLSLGLSAGVICSLLPSTVGNAFLVVRTPVSAIF